MFVDFWNSLVAFQKIYLVTLAATEPTQPVKLDF
jgi:hypothetical protein